MRIKWSAFLIPYGYWGAGLAGAVGMALMIAGIIVLPLLYQMFHSLFTSDEDNREWTAASKDHRRTTYVRVQKPKPLLIGLRIGGRMQGLGWKDVAAERYDTYPEGALEEAVEDYDGYRISHYCEQHPDAEIPEPLEDISERAWIKVNPERDLPDD